MDASLRVPPGVAGKVIDIRVFVRREKMALKEENRRARDIEAVMRSCSRKCGKTASGGSKASIF